MSLVKKAAWLMTGDRTVNFIQGLEQRQINWSIAIPVKDNM